jgi:anti-sigma-K factor RskA
MTDSPNSRALLLAYLLDELSAEERRSMEERMLTDQDFSDELQEAEFDLIDEFHDGALTPAERRRVETALPADRLARPLRAVRHHPTTSYRSARDAWPRWLAIIGAAAAVLLVLVWPFAQWLTRPHQSQSGALQAALSPMQPSPTPAISNDSQNSATAVLLLTPDVSRGTNSPELRLLPSTRSVLVQWVLPAGTSSGPFTLSINEGSLNAITVRQDGNLRSIDGQRLAVFHLSPFAFPKHPASTHMLLTIRNEASPGRLQGEFQAELSWK